MTDRQTPTGIVVTGHVDHGKSTFIGRLLLDLGSLTPDKLADIEKTSRELGKKIEYAFVMDQFKEERDQNITIDTGQTFFNIEGRPFVVIDAPGHKEYLKNMITGATQADQAFLLLDIKEGIREQTAKHADILRLLNLKSPAILINKMDLVDYREADYLRYRDELNALLAQHGLAPVEFIPISAYEGENLLRRSSKMPWYKGPTAVDFMKQCTPIGETTEANGVFPVQLTYAIDGEKFVLGRVESGRIKVGQPVTVFPSGQTRTVIKISKYHEDLSHAGKGQSVALVLDSGDELKRGAIISTEAPPRPHDLQVDSFWASQIPLERGMSLTLECKTQSAQATVTDLHDNLSGEPLPRLQPGDVGQLHLRLDEPLYVSTASTSPSLSRIVFHLNGEVAGCAVVREIS